MGMASFLTKELLNEIGIDAIGDIMAILHRAKRSETVVSIYKYYLSRFLSHPLHPLVISGSVVPFLESLKSSHLAIYIQYFKILGCFFWHNFIPPSE